MFDDLDAFVFWWTNTKTMSVGIERASIYDGSIWGTVLYRQPPYQVELFIVEPNSVIDPHIHPNVDAYEMRLSGDIDFIVDGVSARQDIPIRVLPTSYHGGTFGRDGGVFISIQKWLNGVPPSSVGADWVDKQGNTHGKAYKTGK